MRNRAVRLEQLRQQNRPIDFAVINPRVRAVDERRQVIIDQNRLYPREDPHFVGAVTNHRRLLNLGTLFISINRKGRFIWIGEEVVDRRNAYFTNRCVFLLPQEFQNIFRAFEELSYQLYEDRKKMIIFSQTGAALMRDLYKRQPYDGMRMIDRVGQSRYPTRNGFNLTPDQMQALIT